MRIIGGTLKGLTLNLPHWFKARPTTDRAREALFNILVHSIGIEGKEVLDLFAGSGAISMEYISRGASRITAIEKDKKSVEYIRDIFTKYTDGKAKVVQDDVLKFLKKTPDTYDVIFADPPYSWEGYQPMLDTIMDLKLLRPHGLLIVEHLQGLPLNHPGFVERRVYGQSVFSFYKYQ